MILRAHEYPAGLIVGIYDAEGGSLFEHEVKECDTETGRAIRYRYKLGKLCHDGEKLETEEHYYPAPLRVVWKDGKAPGGFESITLTVSLTTK